MRIEEMRSGTEHFKKRSTPDGSDGSFRYRQLGETHLSAEDCSLDRPEWAVVSFDRVEAHSLTHSQAVSAMQELDSRGVPGLCILTNRAALKP